MKNLVLGIIFCLFLISSSSANAVTFVNYNCAGKPVSISHGAGPSISYMTYQNRLRSGYDYRPSTPRYNHHPRRFPNHMNPHINSPSDDMMAQNKPQTVSRFDKNYTPKRQTSYTKGGITYYN